MIPTQQMGMDVGWLPDPSAYPGDDLLQLLNSDLGLLDCSTICPIDNVVTGVGALDIETTDSDGSTGPSLCFDDPQTPDPFAEKKRRKTTASLRNPRNQRSDRTKGRNGRHRSSIGAWASSLVRGKKRSRRTSTPQLHDTGGDAGAAVVVDTLHHHHHHHHHHPLSHGDVGDIAAGGMPRRRSAPLPSSSACGEGCEFSRGAPVATPGKLPRRVGLGGLPSRRSDPYPTTTAAANAPPQRPALFKCTFAGCHEELPLSELPAHIAAHKRNL